MRPSMKTDLKNRFAIFTDKINIQKMDTLTIELKNPKSKKLIEDLADLDLISILKQASWKERWQKLSQTLPKQTEISEDEIFAEINDIRIQKENI